MMVDIPSGLPFLARGILRPPTPPKESTAKLQEDNAVGDMLPILPALDTPDESPSSSAELPRSLSSKRVKISGHYQYHQPPSSSNRGYDSDDLKPLPPSRECKSTRSILKVSHESTSFSDQRAQPSLDDSSLQAMLRSATQHLASESRSARLDAYNSLVTCLGSYDDVPKNEDLVTNTGDLCRYLRRDLLTRLVGSVVPDLQLVSPAIRLVLALLTIQGVASSMPEDFKMFLAEQALTSLEDGKTPKTIVTQYMHLLEKQKFGSKVFTLDRTGKLLNALDTITSRIKGMRIYGHRLMIYKKLLSQARSIMLSKVDKWLHHLLAALINPNRDTRVRAISFGIEAGLQLGSASHVSRAMIELCNQKLNQERTTFEIVHSHVLGMMNSRDEAVHVPQIWAVFVLLLRNRRSQMMNWEHFEAWFEVLKKCLDYPDLQVRHQAHAAINRLIFATNVDMMTSSMGRTLIGLIKGQMDSRQTAHLGEKESKLSRQSARSTYCMLLYYTFNPNASHDRLSQGWDLFVIDVLASAKAMSKPDANYMSEVVASLLHNDGAPRVWVEKRALASGQVVPNELPCLEAKWIRSRMSIVMKPIRSLFDCIDWTVRHDQEIPVMKVWRNLLSAIGNASSKEVRVSSDTIAALAHVLNQIGHLLEQRTGSASRSTIPAEAISSLIEEAVSKIGTLPFNEKKLVVAADKSLEMVSDTPSRRAKRDSGNVNSGVFHLLQLLLARSQEKDGAAFCVNINNLTQLGLKGAHSRSGRLNVLRNLSQLCVPVQDKHPNQTMCVLWKTVCEAAIEILNSEARRDDASRSAQFPEPDVKCAVKILEIGVRHFESTTYTPWQMLFDQVSAALANEIGNFAITLAVVEPLARVVQLRVEKSLDEVAVKASLKLLLGIHWPQSRHVSERTQTHLWGSDVVLSRPRWTGLSTALLSLINTVLGKLYTSDEDSPREHLALIAAITSIIRDCPPGSRLEFLEKIQVGLSHWLQDAPNALKGSHKDEMNLKVKQLWAVVANIIETLDEASPLLLQRLPILLTASLKSRHKTILNDAIRLWNRVFGSAKSLEYPQELKEVLQKLAAVGDIDLPNLAKGEHEEVDTFPISVIESLEEQQTLESQIPGTRSPMALFLKSGRLSRAESSPKSPCLLSPNSTTLSHRRKASGATPKARLRHDDSQIQFAPIESSPLAPSNVESQMLTERQKEVSARQAQDAAMFPEIRSSRQGTPNSTSNNLPKFALKSRKAREPLPDADSESSPTFLPDNIMQDFLGSSPTPSSSRRRSTEQSPDDDLPSSPPFVSSHLRVPFPASSDARADIPETQNDKLDRKHNNEELRESDKEALFEDANNILSDQEVFVDAPSEPLSDIYTVSGVEKQSEAQRTHGTVNKESIARQTTSKDTWGEDFQTVPKFSPPPEEELGRCRSELNDEVTRLLNSFSNEVTRSQEEEGGVESSQDRTAQSQGGTRKRKHSANGDVSACKRTATGDTNEVEVPRSTMRPREVEADCVLIKAGPAQGLFHSVSPETSVKMERSESPPGISSLPSFVEETVLSGRQRPRPRDSRAEKRRGSQDKHSQRQSRAKMQIQREYIPDGDPPIGGSRRRSGRRSHPTSDDWHEDTADMRSMPSLATKAGGAETGAEEEEERQEQEQEQEEGDVSGRVKGSGIVQGFRDLLGQLKQVNLRPEEAEEVLALVWEIGPEAQAAARGRNHRRDEG